MKHLPEFLKLIPGKLLTLTKGLEELFGVVYYSTGNHLLNTINIGVKQLVNKDWAVPRKYVLFLLVAAVIAVFVIGLLTVVRFMKRKKNADTTNGPKVTGRVGTRAVSKAKATINKKTRGS